MNAAELAGRARTNLASEPDRRCDIEAIARSAPARQSLLLVLQLIHLPLNFAEQQPARLFDEVVVHACDKKIVVGLRFIHVSEEVLDIQFELLDIGVVVHHAARNTEVELLDVRIDIVQIRRNGELPLRWRGLLLLWSISRRCARRRIPEGNIRCDNGNFCRCLRTLRLGPLRGGGGTATDAMFARASVISPRIGCFNTMKSADSETSSPRRTSPPTSWTMTALPGAAREPPPPLMLRRARSQVQLSAVLQEPVRVPAGTL